MIEMVAQVAVTVFYYHLLKPVNRSVARLEKCARFQLTTGNGVHENRGKRKLPI